eukprot:11202617-Lingulodinium_polyedra.AAC.1
MGVATARYVDGFPTVDFASGKGSAQEAFTPCARQFSGRGVRKRAICEPLRRRTADSTAALCS